MDIGWQRRGISVFMAGDVLGKNIMLITIPSDSLGRQVSS